jgi:hypothetical protein
MPPPSRIIRTVKDIRTHFGSPEQTNVPYKMYMVITALEMEQFRREKERNNLRLRLASIDNRLDAIHAEKAVLLERINTARDTDRRRSDYSARTTPGAIPRNTMQPKGQSAGGIRFQY